MKRAASLAVVALLVTACFVPKDVELTAVQKAELAYAQTSLAYEASMQVTSDLRAARKVTDDQWAIVERVQVEVRKYTPIWRSALDVWKLGGSKPETLDIAKKKVEDALQLLQAVETNANG